MKLTMSCLAYFVLLGGVLSAAEAPKLPIELRDVGIDQKLGSAVPLDTAFMDEHDQSRTLAEFFGAKPVVLALVYYRCPMLCTQILQGVVTGLRPLSLRAGRDFEVVAISIDPEDSPSTAREKQTEFTRRYWQRDDQSGWHFLTGTQDSIHAITEAVGFHYKFDEKSNMFIHASAVMVLTPDGRVARYFYGVDYEPKNLKLGLIEASGNKIGSLADQVLLFCYHYDPASGKYGAVVMNILRGASLLTLLILSLTLGILWRHDLRGHARSWNGGTRR